MPGTGPTPLPRNMSDRNAPDHEHVAVGEVDELDDPVDHRVAQGDEGVDRADRERVRHLLDRDLARLVRRRRIEAQEEPQDEVVRDDQADRDGRDVPPSPGAGGTRPWRGAVTAVTADPLKRQPIDTRPGTLRPPASSDAVSPTWRASPSSEPRRPCRCRLVGSTSYTVLIFWDVSPFASNVMSPRAIWYV